MSLFRLLLIGILLYWGMKLVGGLIKLFNSSEKQKVEGKPQGKGPLDLSDHDVEDADFKEID